MTQMQHGAESTDHQPFHRLSRSLFLPEERFRIVEPMRG